MITFSSHGQALSRGASANLSRTLPPRFDTCMQASTAQQGNERMTGSYVIAFFARTLRAVLVRALTVPIIGYRLLISPFLPPACRFHPSCSRYALDALRVHGPFKGTWLAVRRLTRCHPFTVLGGGSGCDPVPPASR
jgi:uncharacterized protein